MNRTEVSKEFSEKKERYNRLGQNITDALKTFLNEADIPYLDIYYRVKKFDSFYEKIERKKYKSPFNDIEDICGIRVICYYNSDLDKINSIIKNEFKVLEEQNKSDLLSTKEFAYRSHHFIVRTNKEWQSAPNYRNLGDFKAEIQVRTILMHAWAEIEHKLNYKNDAQVPDKFQRKLFRLSAKFEEADEQFEELRIGIDTYKIELKSKIEESNDFNLNQDFNLESFKAFIDYKLPGREWENIQLSNSFDIISKYGDDAFKVLSDSIEKINPHIEEILTDLEKEGYDSSIYPQSMIIIWMSLDIVDHKRFNEFQDSDFEVYEPWERVQAKWTKKLK